MREGERERERGRERERERESKNKREGQGDSIEKGERGREGWMKRKKIKRIQMGREMGE